jgi:hypothetical protein
LIFGLTSLLSGVLTLLMPETANCELPDTVAEAEAIGRKQRKPLLQPHDNDVKLQDMTNGRLLDKADNGQYTDVAQ